jgi:hypothetical protein
LNLGWIAEWATSIASLICRNTSIFWLQCLFKQMIVNGIKSVIAIHESWHLKIGIASRLFRNACILFIFLAI